MDKEEDGDGYDLNEFEGEEEEEGEEEGYKREAEEDVPAPEKLTQHYLRLRNEGRLSRSDGSSYSGSHQHSHTPSVTGPNFKNGWPMEAEEEVKQDTVFRAEQQRLKQLTESMAVQPLSVSRSGSRNPSRQGMRPGTEASWNSHGQAWVQAHSHPHHQPPPSRSASLPPEDFLAQQQPEIATRPATTDAQAPNSMHKRRHSSSSRSTRSAHSHFSSLSALNLQSKTRPGRPIYSPGPGAYSPPTDRYGRLGTSEKPRTAFGTAPQRPGNVCLAGTGVDSVVSPGPAYNSSPASIAMRPTSPRFSFGRRDIGTRTNPRAEHPSNAPLWNPGPGNYDVQRLANGMRWEAGAESPHAIFGVSPKLMTPQTNIAATPFVSAGHALKENVGVHSPGPARYSQDSSPTRTSPAKYSMAKKAPSYFDAFLDPGRQPSPGPVYRPTINSHADRPWNPQSATFGKSTKYWDPARNLSAAPFVSHSHARVANQSVHSPGVGAYRPKHPQPKVHSTLLSSGPKDRFYDRFEPGRLG
ncbi:hypothetical protein DUNSADRAFT_6230 [Dunaliella salina]|uniref:Uncharacterized protein n=1 Tax=Dunaliella salina TaxID=3046 RepID=A0ABQ7GNQ0_DUNSA|nr:hypothetical protein DUNSADRAFT_6230 [Dunaliella salina]|eukprot:KAF5836218.1 hypothetical protein DUNSADRAFT_6230 [Dunaliella salina]